MCRYGGKYVASQKQLSVVFDAVKPPKATSWHSLTIKNAYRLRYIALFCVYAPQNSKLCDGGGQRKFLLYTSQRFDRVAQVLSLRDLALPSEKSCLLLGGARYETRSRCILDNRAPVLPDAASFKLACVYIHNPRKKK